jgi:hypothetical protein
MDWRDRAPALQDEALTENSSPIKKESWSWFPEAVKSGEGAEEEAGQWVQCYTYGEEVLVFYSTVEWK